MKYEPQATTTVFSREGLVAAIQERISEATLFDTFQEPDSCSSYWEYFGQLGLHVGLTPSQINHIWADGNDPMDLRGKAKEKYNAYKRQ
ncbi:hypothetical protein SPB21_03675 [Leptothoe sp. ISB3NOV94-8A]